MARWYTTFQQGNAPGSPYGQMGPGQMQRAGVFVTPNDREPTQTVANAINPVPTGANPVRLALAKQMMATGASTAPVQSPLEGLARALQGGIGGYIQGQENRAQQAREAATTGNLASMLGFTPEEAAGLSAEQMIAARTAITPKEGKETWRPATAREVAEAGLPEGAWQVSSQGKFRDPSRAGVNVDLGGTYDEKAAERRAMSDQDYRTELRTQANQARGKIPSFRRLRTLLESGDVETGALQPVRRWASQMFTAFGQNPEDYGLPNAASAEEVRALTNRMVMDSLDAFAGALSEKELDFAQAASASERLTPEANIALIDLAERAAKRQVEQYSALRKWNRQYGSPGATNDKGQDFEDFWDAYIQEQGEGFEAPSLTASPAEAAPETSEAGMAGDLGGMSDTYTDPNTGATYRWDGKTYRKVD